MALSTRGLARLEKAALGIGLRAYVERNHAGNSDALAVVESVIQDWPLISLREKLGIEHPLVRDLERRRFARRAVELGVSAEEFTRLEAEAVQRTP
jgi:hypothetical protein